MGGSLAQVQDYREVSGMPLCRLSRRAWFGRGASVGTAVLTLALIGACVPLGTAPVLAAPSAGRNLIQNGCFQDSVLTSGYLTLGQGSMQIPGWTVGANSVDVVAANHWRPAPGCNQSVGLVGDSPGSVSQTVNTTFGDIYLLQWKMAADYNCGPVVKRMYVFWEGRLVAAPSFDMRGDGQSSMGWASKEVTVTAASNSSVIEFADGTTGGGPCGATLDGVSLTLQSETVNGFAATNSSDPYSVAERQMLAKMPGRAVVNAAGTPVCTLQPVAAEQVNNANGLVIIWEITPSAGFIKQTAAARMAESEVVEQYFAGLLKTSRALYVAALKSDRVPLEGEDLSNSWGVRVQSLSTTGSLMTFQMSRAGTSSWIIWANVFGVNSTSQALAPEALANLLYYAQDVGD
jgi:choice-of-anchor C domain-containing protein